LFEQALALCRDAEPSDTTIRAAAGMFDHYVARGQLPAAARRRTSYWTTDNSKTT
jgi:hypothetical protein